MTAYWILFQRLPWDKRILVAVLVLSGVTTILAQLRAPSEGLESANPPAETYNHSADTHIPRGFVLIPIEVQNYEALDSILGKYGLVDLYQSPPGKGSQRLVARNVRILRAPQNLSHFAVLVPERDAANTLSFAGPFTVIVKRPQVVGTEFVKDEAKAQRTIVYGEG